MKTFSLYKEKLNKSVNFLWQRPQTKFDLFSDEFDAAPVGRDPLNSHMKFLSEKAKLSKTYTNHCIRATVVTTLDEKGFEARDIMATTGHKSECSIRSYVKCPPKKRRNISDALASTLHQNSPEVQPKMKKIKPTSTITKPQEINPEILPENAQLVELFPTFDDENDIPDEEIINVLTQIEESNRAVQPQQNENSDLIQNTINVANVANVNRAPMLPQKYFPNSTVTINYNFASK